MEVMVEIPNQMFSIGEVVLEQCPDNEVVKEFIDTFKKNYAMNREKFAKSIGYISGVM